MRPKDQLPTTERSAIVYKIDCMGCKINYIGETSKRLKTRLHEHKLAIRRGEQHSQIWAHIAEHDHYFDFENTQILANDATKGGRLLKEAWFSGTDSINRHVDLCSAHQALRTLNASCQSNFQRRLSYKPYNRNKDNSLTPHPSPLDHMNGALIDSSPPTNTQLPFNQQHTNHNERPLHDSLQHPGSRLPLELKDNMQSNGIRLVKLQNERDIVKSERGCEEEPPSDCSVKHEMTTQSELNKRKLPLPPPPMHSTRGRSVKQQLQPRQESPIRDEGEKSEINNTHWQQNEQLITVNEIVTGDALGMRKRNDAGTNNRPLRTTHKREDKRKNNTKWEEELTPWLKEISKHKQNRPKTHRGTKSNSDTPPPLRESHTQDDRETVYMRGESTPSLNPPISELVDKTTYKGLKQKKGICNNLRSAIKTQPDQLDPTTHSGNQRQAFNNYM